MRWKFHILLVVVILFSLVIAWLVAFRSTFVVENLSLGRTPFYTRLHYVLDIFRRISPLIVIILLFSSIQKTKHFILGVLILNLLSHLLIWLSFLIFSLQNELNFRELYSFYHYDKTIRQTLWNNGLLLIHLDWISLLIQSSVILYLYRKWVKPKDRKK